MEVYFVRHGQTDGNVGRRHQHVDTPLNFIGQAQVEALAKEIIKIKPTHLISSTQLRAMETTRIINKVYPILPDTSPYFEELKRPQWLIGNRYFSFKTLRYVFEWFFKNKIEDGESYDDFLERSKQAKKYLEALPEEARVVVVSHAVFINIFVEHLCLDTKMRFLEAPLSFFRMLSIKNAQITHLHYSPGKNICGWSRVK